MCHKKQFPVASCQSNLARTSQPSVLQLLLLRSRLLCRFLGRSLLLDMSLDGLRFGFVLFLMRCRGLLYLGLLLRQLGSLEALPVKGDLGNAHCGVRLPVSAQLFVLLLAFVVENQNLRAASLFHEFADHPRSCLRLPDLAFATRHSQYFRELHLAIGARSQLLDSNYIPGRHPVLLAAGADNRVHTSASVKIS